MDKQLELDTDKVIEELIVKYGMTEDDVDMLRKCKMGVCKVDGDGNIIKTQNK